MKRRRCGTSLREISTGAVHPFRPRLEDPIHGVSPPFPWASPLRGFQPGVEAPLHLETHHSGEGDPSPVLSPGRLVPHAGVWAALPRLERVSERARAMKRKHRRRRRRPPSPPPSSPHAGFFLISVAGLATATTSVRASRSTPG